MEYYRRHLDGRADMDLVMHCIYTECYPTQTYHPMKPNPKDQEPTRCSTLTRLRRSAATPGR